MPTPTPKPAAHPFAPEEAAAIREIVASLRGITRAKSLRALVAILYEVHGKPKRTEVSAAAKAAITRDTLAGKTAVEIAAALDLSVPCINAQRRILKLTKHRAKPAAPIPADHA